MKTIVHVWTQAPCNVTVTPYSWRFGIGDLIRGSIGAIQYCEKRGYECIIDISLHPISQLLKVEKHKYSQLIQDNASNIHAIFPENVDAYVQQQLTSQDVVYLFSNFTLDVFDTAPSTGVINTIKTLLTPNDEFSAYVDSMMMKLPQNNYDILHYRLGDSEVIDEKSSVDYSQYLTHLSRVIRGDSVLISDSVHFKNNVRMNLNVFMYDEPVSHLGFHTDKDKIRHTLFEFILLTKACSIRTHTVYGWTSGFTRIANYIYSVPLQCI